MHPLNQDMITRNKIVHGHMEERPPRLWAVVLRIAVTVTALGIALAGIGFTISFLF